MRWKIVLKDLSGFLERSSFLHANALRVRRLLGHPPIVLCLDQLRIKPGEAQELLPVMRRFCSSRGRLQNRAAGLVRFGARD